MEGFPYWGDGGVSSPPAESLFIPLHLEKCPTQHIFVPPTK